MIPQLSSASSGIVNSGGAFKVCWLYQMDSHLRSGNPSHSFAALSIRTSLDFRSSYVRQWWTVTAQDFRSITLPFLRLPRAVGINYFPNKRGNPAAMVGRDVLNARRDESRCSTIQLNRSAWLVLNGRFSRR